MPSLEFSSSEVTDHGLPAILRAFVDKMSTDLTRFPLPDDSKVWNSSLALIKELSPEDQRKVSRYMPLCYQIAVQIYSHCPHESKVFVTVFCALGYYVNDRVSDELALQMESFPSKFNTGVSHDNSYLDLLERLLTIHLPKIAGPIARGCIIKSTLDYFIGILMQRRLAATPPTKLTREFPVWQRRKTGLSESMAFLAFPEAEFPEVECLHHYLPVIPCLVQLIDEINDVLSSYKELIIGKEANQIKNIAIANGWSIEKAAETFSNNLVAVKVNLDKALAGNPVITADDISLFVDGWIIWHLQQSKRYKLDQIGLQL